MDRVAFLLEPSGERIGCLLNPETLVVRRTAGLRSRRALGGGIAGGAPLDDPLLFTGGGCTELLLELLFDVSLLGSTVETEDVRELTAPLWRLAENGQAEDGRARPPRVRFVWGKAWNLPGIVASVAERLEHFAPSGAPRRSWLRMRLLRVDDAPEAEAAAPALSEAGITAEQVVEQVPPESFEDHEVLGAERGPGAGGQRLDEIASQYYGDPALWRLIAELNGISDPSQIPPGQVLRLPSAAALRRVT
ncbi:LysM peptidoglycan-binding domain-containing protein [Myxococcaceae bacterium GXIMD 01537]